VAELSLYKNLSELSALGFPLNNFTRRENVSQFVFATAAGDWHLHIAMDAIAVIQAHFPQQSIYFYDMSDNVNNNKADKVNEIGCAALTTIIRRPFDCISKVIKVTVM